MPAGTRLRAGGESLGDIFRIAVRTAHLLAATTWIGGALFYALALSPNVSREHAALVAVVNHSYRIWVKASVWTLSTTGVFMVVDRLTNATLGPLYASLVVAKIGLAIAMFSLALVLADRAERRTLKRLGRAGAADGEALAATRPGRAARRKLLTPSFLIVILGIVVYVLGATLEVISRSLAG